MLRCVMEEEEFLALVYPTVRVFAGELRKVKSPFDWEELGVLALLVTVLMWVI